MRAYYLSVAFFAFWWVAVAIGLKVTTIDAGKLPVDYRTYSVAADLMRTSGSPYPGIDAAQDAWRSMHDSLMAAFRPDEAATDEVEVVSGPYLYPPSLALVIGQGEIAAVPYLVLLTFATVGICVGWLWLSGQPSILWLLGMAGSADLSALFLLGNVEILLMTLSLVACLLIWRRRHLWASPLIAIVILVKPQFTLLFLAFGCIWLFNNSAARAKVIDAIFMIALVILLVVLEVSRWPVTALLDFLNYARNPSSLQYFALTPEQQWPIDTWNRSPLQVLLTMGLPFQAAQVIVAFIYVVILGLSVVLLRHERASFAVLFSVSYIVFLVGRPITWTMPWLAIFTLTSVWPVVTASGRKLLTVSAILIGASHWVAFALFASGIWPGLLTLQFPAFPWETLIVLPAAWIVIVTCARSKPAPGMHRNGET